MTFFPFDIVFKAVFAAALVGLVFWFAGTALMPDQWKDFTTFFETHDAGINWDSLPTAFEAESKNIQATIQGWIRSNT
jgi:hypothetical protein